MPYNWQLPDWPDFPYDLSGVEETLYKLAEKAGRASGLLKGLTADAQLEATIEMMVVEAVKTSAIEGELLSRRDVMSAIRKNLGIETGHATGDKVQRHGARGTERNSQSRRALRHSAPHHSSSILLLHCRAARSQL